MARRLPPLNALRTFEAAGRCLSFKKAAEELYVTHGAVSRQIKLLEDHLGVELFQRQHRQVMLTEAGKRLLDAVTQAMDHIEEATRALASEHGRGPLVVACLATLSLRWLVPRLGRFHAAHPGIELRLVTSAQEMDLERDGLDVMIDVRQLEQRDDSRCVEAFAPDEFGLVCSPALLARYSSSAPVAHPRDLAGCTALHTETRPALWEDWFAESGFGPVRFASSQVYDHLYLVLEAAVAGMGLAIGPRLVVADDIASGRLVAPFGFVRRPGMCIAIYKPAQRGDHRIAALLAWLRQEAAPR